MSTDSATNVATKSVARAGRGVIQVHRAVVSHLLFVVTTILTSSGCSFIFVHGPPNHPEPGRVVDCTTSRVAPVVDSILTALEVVRIGTDLSVSDDAFSATSIGKGGDITLGVAFFGLFLASSIYGYQVTAQCDATLRGEPPEPTAHQSTRGNSTAGNAEKASPDHVGAPGRDGGDSGSLGFDLQTARNAVEAALSRAVQACRSGGEPRGEHAATLTYEPDGHVSDVRIDPSFPDATLDACVANSIRDAKIAPYDGDSMIVRKRFIFGEAPSVDGGAPEAGVGANGAPSP